jgi:membrane-associated phospholipid phosphatase
MLARRQAGGYKWGMKVWPLPWVILLYGMGISLLLWGSGADLAVQVWLNGHYNQFFNGLFRVFGWLGLGRNQVAAVLLVGIGRAIYGWWAGEAWLKQRRWAACWRAAPVRLKAWLGCVPVFLVAGGGVVVLKLLVGRPRPKEILWNALPYGDLHPAWLSGKFQAAFMGWPSGHSASTFAIGTVLMLAFPRRRWPLLAVMALLSAARFLALTPHYLGDVVAGAAWGAFVALMLAPKLGLKGRKVEDKR